MIAPGMLTKCPDSVPRDFDHEVELIITGGTQYTTDFDGTVYTLIEQPTNDVYAPIYGSPFESGNNVGLLHKLKKSAPIVGNIHAGQVLGLDDLTCEELLTATRPTYEGTFVTVLEPTNYFGLEDTLLRVPRVVLIRVMGDGAGLISLFKTTYNYLIEKYKLQMIFEGVTDANRWSPFSYGAPHDGWVAPGSKEPFRQFEGGELLTIYFTGNSFGPVVETYIGNFPPMQQDVGFQVVITPYFVTVSSVELDYPAAYTGSAGGPPDPPPASTDPGFAHLSAPSSYTTIAGADGTAESTYWSSLANKYYRRGFYMHNSPDDGWIQTMTGVGSGEVVWGEDGGDPAQYTIVEDNRVVTESTTNGASPPGGPDAAGYFNMFAAPGMVLGREVNLTAEDLAAAISEDIEAFWGS